MRRLRPLRQRRLRPQTRLDAADPGRCADGLERGTTGFGWHHAPQAAAQRRARLRSRVRGDTALVRGGLGIGRRAGRGADAAEHRRRLPQRRQRRPQLLRADERTGVRQVPVAAADHRARPRRRHGRDRRHDDHAQHGRQSRVLQQARVRHRRRPEPRHQGLRHALRRRHRRSRDPISRSSRRPTTTRPTARTSRAATTGSPVRSRSSRPAGWDAGWTTTAPPRTRCRRSRSTPACPSRSAR